MEILITNIKELLQVREGSEALRGAEMNEVPRLHDAWLHAKDGLIDDFGKMADGLPTVSDSAERFDATGRFVLPAYCDSHSHLIFAATREKEFEDRIRGLTYQEIAENGGGILNSAKKLQAMSEEELFEQASERLKGLIAMGTGALEIKSGYGLTTEAELKMLRVAKRLKEESGILIKSTFLGAHAIPTEFKSNREAYIDLVLHEMIPQVADHGLADYIDVFCETNYFTVEETIRLMERGAEFGMKPKVHVNQFTTIGGVQAAADHNALSVDHLEEMSSYDYTSLEGSKTIATALPSCSFFLGIPYSPVKKMMEHNIAVALATDYNPGSTPSGNMNFVFSLACIKMGLTPEQALNALTVNGAGAMELGEQVGSIAKGKKAKLIITRPMDSLARIPYSFGESIIERVLI